MGSVLMAWATGAAAFAPPMDQEIRGTPGQYLGHDLVVGDFDGDGFDDLAIRSSTQYQVHHGSAAGLDALPTWTLARTGQAMVRIDANGDGFDDLALLNDRTAELYLGSAGGLAAARAWSANLGDSSGPLAAGDVNGDGFEDLAAVHFSGYYTSNATIWRGFASGLRVQPNQDFLSDHGSLAMADMNGDGFDDLVVGDPYDSYSRGGRVTIHVGSANGVSVGATWTVTNPVNFHVPGVGNFLGPAGDLNGDGYEDVVTNLPTNAYQPLSNAVLQEAFVLYGSPQGPSTLIVHTAYGALFEAAIAPDIDGDNRDELVVAYADALVNGTPRGGAAIFRRGVLPPNSPTLVCLGDVREGAGRATATGDFDGDGQVDWAVSAAPDNAGTVAIRYGL